MDEALLDTDILSELLKQRHPIVRRKAGQYLKEKGRFTFSVFTRFEITRGYKEKNAVRQLQRFEVFCQRSLILPADDTVFEQAGELWVAARRGGHSHGDADLIIAATARESGRVLVTGNTPHFAWIPGLRLEDWRQP
jgi:predicted nucleic acid-binding protein